MRLMDELHRVFHRHDVAGRVSVAVVDHRSERSRLTRPRGAYDQHQSALGHHDVFERVGQSQLGKVGNLVGNGPDHHADILLLHEHIDPEARDTGQRDREVALQLPGELLALAGIHQGIRQVARDIARELLIRHGLHPAAQLHARWEILRDEQVRSACLAHGGEQLVDIALRLLFGEIRHSPSQIVPSLEPW